MVSVRKMVLMLSVLNMSSMLRLYKEVAVTLFF